MKNTTCLNARMSKIPDNLILLKNILMVFSLKHNNFTEYIIRH